MSQLSLIPPAATDLSLRRRTGISNGKRDLHDFTPTPDDVINDLLDRETFDGTIWEPACGDGAISKNLIKRGYDVFSSDLIDRGYGQARTDFLMEYKPCALNIVTNPPFKLALQFMLKALALTTGKVALFLPLSYQQGGERYRKVWSVTPIAKFYVFTRRVKMYRGGWDDGMGGNGMMNFMWALWDHSHPIGKPPITIWI